jgi:mycothiol synthase
MPYIWRALERADTPRWAEFTEIVSDADDLDEAYSADDLAEELDDPELDPRLDTIAVEDDDGTLVAVGQMMAPRLRPDGTVRADFAGYVHPQHRGLGVGAELLDRLQRRAIELAAQRHPGAAVRRQTHVGAGVTGARQLLEAQGYRPVRYFHAMGRSLERAAATDDARVQPYDPARDAEVYEAHCEAFTTHWGYAAPTPAQWQSRMTGSRTFRPQCSVLGVGSDGGIDGYVLCYQFQPGEAWIGQLGVRPPARGRGLARAMLLRTLALAASDFTVAKLDVDSDNPAGAGRLYESVGFTRERTTVIYEAADHDSEDPRR